MSRSFKATCLLFIGLAILVALLQYFIFSPHLRYGFADVDWDYLVSFKEYNLLFRNPVDHFLYAWAHWGVYTYQVYYIGLIETLFGMDYRNFQIVTHLFKYIGTLCVFPVVLVITKRRLVAFLTTIIYAVAYPAVGAMYTVVTSGLYVAIPVMCLFLIWYWHLINKEKNTILEIILAVVLFILTLFLATERMFPLLPTIFIVEFFGWFKSGYSKKTLFSIAKRLLGFVIVFVVIFSFNRSDLAGFLGGNSKDTYNRLIWGNWQVLLSPVVSFGSLFLPRDYWKFLGTPNIDNFLNYLTFFITGPSLIFASLTAFLSLFLSKKRKKFIFLTLILTFIFAMVIYFLASHQMHIPPAKKMGFDINNILPALLGGFVISLTVSLFKEWLDTGRKDTLVISMVGGITMSLIFIVLTWIAADYVLVFSGVHRYLTVPSLGSSLFLAGLVTIIFNRLRAFKPTRQIAIVVFFIPVLLIIFDARVINDYFTYELNYAGTDAEGHIRMKNKLWSFLPNFSKTEPSIFYFDESADHDNGYFDETTVMAGFNFWMRFRGGDIVNAKLTPAILRSNLICAEPRSMCLDKVKSFVVTQNGEKGLLYAGIFYKAENFYAFRFINKDLVDIKPEMVELIGLN